MRKLRFRAGLSKSWGSRGSLVFSAISQAEIRFSTLDVERDFIRMARLPTPRPFIGCAKPAPNLVIQGLLSEMSE